ncbi:MAG: hypothetical protein AMXMBFR13_22650 [Phycisphaerae bacterium]
MGKCIALVLPVGLLLAVPAFSAVTTSTDHGAQANSLDGMIRVGDVISGLTATELAGDTGWHPANGDPLDHLPAFTDDAGIRASGLTGLLNDFPGAGNPAKLVEYDLGGAIDIAEIGILTGNNGRDGRVFSTTVINYSTDNGSNFEMLGYFQSDPSGTLNNTQQIGSTYLTVSDDASATLLPGVTHLQFLFFAVDNGGGQMRDPYDGVNPYTGADDGLTAAHTSPLVLEIDVVQVPEPGALVLLSIAGLLLRRRSRA